MELTPSTPGTMTVVAASAADVASARPIEEGRVSTHRLLKADGARIMLIAFDAGQEMKEHTAAAPILVQCVTGRLRVEAGGESVELEPGGLLHITARMPHAVAALEPSHLQLTLLA